MERLPFEICVTQEIKLNDHKYQFKGSILHYGPRNSGHYKTLIQNNGFYYLYSDSFIERYDDIIFSNYNENFDILMYQQI